MGRWDGQRGRVGASKDRAAGRGGRAVTSSGARHGLSGHIGRRHLVLHLPIRLVRNADVAGSVTCAMYNSTFFLQVHPKVPTTFLASCNSLYRTLTNISPGNWTPLFTPPAGRVVRSAIDAGTGSDLYYAGTDIGHVFSVPADGSPGRTSFRPNSQNVSDIEVDSAHPDTVYVSFAPPFTVDRPCTSTAGQNRIYQLRRHSPLPNPTFSSADITGNLRSKRLCVNALAVDPHIPRTSCLG
jgi:hypothetical protein